MRKIYEFEVLRGLLALWVVLGHITNSIALKIPGPFPQNLNGRLAVDVFIILSGFVITHLIFSKKETYLKFIVRRFFRLFPAYFVVLVISSLMINLSIDALEGTFQTSVNKNRIALFMIAQNDLGNHFIWHLTMLHGVIPNSIAKNSAFTLVGQAWSVSVEWQYYLLIVPFLRVLTSNRFLIRLLLILFVVLAGIKWPYTNGKMGLLSSHLYLFGIGMSCSYLWRKIYFKELKISLRELNTVTISALIVTHLIFEVTLPIMVWILFFHLALRNLLQKPNQLPNPFQNFFNSNVLLYLGKISYSMYLCHMTVLYYVMWFLNKYSFGIGLHALLMLTIIPFFTIILSHFLNKFIEKPGIYLGQTLARKFR